MPIYNLAEDHYTFPDPEEAEEDGLLAIGGDLSAERIVNAYLTGIFPWFSEGDPILWWCPNPRCVLIPDEIKISKSMHSLLKKKVFRVSINQNFEHVTEQCGKINRKNQDGTWITDEVKTAYTELHELDLAHSVEVWDENEIVGGLYGILIGNVFYGESMFAKKSNASKFGFITFVNFLKELGVNLIDCQMHTSHLESLGAKLMERKNFLSLLKKNNLKKYNLNIIDL